MTHPITADTILHGDCIALMAGLPAGSMDCIVTDPPYLVRYQSRDGRGVPNDDNARLAATGLRRHVPGVEAGHVLRQILGVTTRSVQN